MGIPQDSPVWQLLVDARRLVASPSTLVDPPTWRRMCDACLQVIDQQQVIVTQHGNEFWAGGKEFGLRQGMVYGVLVGFVVGWLIGRLL